MRQRGGQWKPQQMQDGWVLSGLAGSRGRAELCLPPSSAALSGFFLWSLSVSWPWLFSNGCWGWDTLGKCQQHALVWESCLSIPAG